MNRASIQPTTWAKVRDHVKALNPELFNAIEIFKPGPNYRLYTLRYAFGSNIIENGKILIPDSLGTPRTIDYPGLDAKTQQDLAYSPIPFGLCLKSSLELYVDMDKRIIPLHVFLPGDTFGLWEVLEPNHSLFGQRMWNVAAGARSLFMLPKITDAICLNRLSKACGLHSLSPPKHIFEQAPLFSDIVHSRPFQSEWSCEILLFSNKWFQEHEDNLGWYKFQYFLLKHEWVSNIYWRNKLTFELIGQAFASAQAHKNLKPNTYLIDTVLHIVSLAVGSSVGFAPAVKDDETSGPCQAIQQAFTALYGLKAYIPTLMQPRALLKDGPIYYSLQTPTVLASSPNTRITHSVIEDLRMVKRLLEALTQQLAYDHPPIYQMLEATEFTFFHTEADEYYDILSSKEIPKGDPRFLNNLFAEDREFCDSGSFLRGCVRIRRLG